MTVKDKFEEIMIKYGIKSLKDLAEEIKVREGNLYIAISKKHITRNVALSINRKFPKVNPENLMKNTGPLFFDDNLVKEMEETYMATIDHFINKVEDPVIRERIRSLHYQVITTLQSEIIQLKDEIHKSKNISSS